MSSEKERQEELREILSRELAQNRTRENESQHMIILNPIIVDAMQLHQQEARLK